MPLHLVGTSIRRSNGCDTGTRLAVRHNSKRSVDIGVDLRMPSAGNTTLKIALGVAIRIVIRVDLRMPGVGDTGRGKTDIVEDLLKLVTGDCELRTTVTAIGVVLLDAVVWWLPLVRWIVRHGDCI